MTDGDSTLRCDTLQSSTNVLMCRMHVLPPHSLLQAINQHNFARLSNGIYIARRVSHIWIRLAVRGLVNFHCLPYTQVNLSPLQNTIKFTSQNNSRILARVGIAIGNIIMITTNIKSLMAAINLCINKNFQSSIIAVLHKSTKK